MDPMLIVQRRDARTGHWLDTVKRHSMWKAQLMARRKCRITGHDYRIIAAHSRAVLETALASELGYCCSLDQRIRNRHDHGLRP
jgi:hypothetical protein